MWNSSGAEGWRASIWSGTGRWDHLHAHGIIHRDVKPSNIFLTGEGTVKLGDFGIIHLESEEGLTRTGETVGTPTHMSPEQFQGKDLTPASDYYALGVTIYQALVGATPFTGTYGELAVQHLEHAPPALPRGVASPGMRRLVQGLLLKEPNIRWGKAELDRFSKGKRLPFLPRHKAAGLFCAAALLVVAGLLLAWDHLRMAEPTSVKAFGEAVSCWENERLLWEKNIPDLTDAALADTDGDGRAEVVLGKRLDLHNRRAGIVLNTLEADGRPGESMILSRTSPNAFPAFSPQFETYFSPLDGASIGILIQHRAFYPSNLVIWDGRVRAPVFWLQHSGRFYQVRPFHGGLAAEGINNRFLHQRVLLVTGPIGSVLHYGSTIVDDTNTISWKDLRAYHLLGPDGFARVEGPDAVSVRLPGRGLVPLLPDGTITGQPPGTGGRTLAFLREYRKTRELILQGGSAEAAGALDRLITEAEAADLPGYAVLLASLKAEALMRQGKADAAQDTAVRYALKHPAYGMDLFIQAGLYALLDDNPPSAVAILRRASSDQTGGRREEIRTIIQWAAMLQSPQGARAGFVLQEDRVPKDLYWRSYMELQAGWIELLEGRAPQARAALAPAIRASDMDHHATGYFLASILIGAFDAKEFDSYMERSGARPEYMLWIGALGKGDTSEAARHWMLLKEDAYHTPDSALMLALLTRVKTVYGL